MSFFGSRLLPYPLPGPQPSEAGARRRTMAHREAVRRRKEIRIAPGGGRTLPGDRENHASWAVELWAGKEGEKAEREEGKSGSKTINQ
ncbi:hypothetical protein EYF80_012343 [Liparis tanakae]|uniref:Uncharacterized protein n=1 Tax=Liparis tanakae TaxID=230148 RepID=A0A4Z2IH82_9TELE|nr:hypothetical protein EYF80_012343 [Liparis tanakae]